MKRINFLKVVQVKESAGLYELGDGIIRRPGDVVEALDTLFPDLRSAAEENLVMITLNTKNKIVGAHEISKGSLSASVVHPREIFKHAVLNNAASFIIAHNHPSGNPTPSPQDIDLTRNLVKACRIMGISLLDHVILGETSHSSLREMGYVEDED